MPGLWASPIPQWNLSLLNQHDAERPRQHPPPAPASSSYSPAPTARSEALRPPSSGFFARFTTPRLGHRPVEAPDVPPIPINLEAHGGSDSLYEAGPGRRSNGSASVIEDVNVPGPLFGATSSQQRQPGVESGSNIRPALQPPAPIHPASANTAAGDLPITFSPSEIGTPNPNPANSSSSTAANPPSRPRRHRRHRHRRHHAAHHRVDSNLSTSSTYKPKPLLSNPAIKLKLLHVCISGALLLLTLIIFLALSPTTPVFSQPFRIVNSLLIVFFAIIFVHACIRLQTLIFEHRRKQRRVLRKNKEVDSTGSVDLGAAVGIGSGANGTGSFGRSGRVQYFDDPEIGLPPPGEPIRVVLARDEEIGVNDDLVAEDEHAAHATTIVGGSANPTAQPDRQSPRVQGTPKPPPPVYGVWRGSVRADPNLLHWQRVERQGRSESGNEEDDMEDVELGQTHSRPPPSYVTQEMRGHGGLETLPATRYVI